MDKIKANGIRIVIKGGQEYVKDDFSVKEGFRKRPLLSRLMSYGRHGSDTTLSHPVF